MTSFRPTSQARPHALRASLASLGRAQPPCTGGQGSRWSHQGVRAPSLRKITLSLPGRGASPGRSDRCRWESRGRSRGARRVRGTHAAQAHRCRSPARRRSPLAAFSVPSGGFLRIAPEGASVGSAAFAASKKTLRSRGALLTSDTPARPCPRPSSASTQQEAISPLWGPQLRGPFSGGLSADLDTNIRYSGIHEQLAQTSARRRALAGSSRLRALAERLRRKIEDYAAGPRMDAPKNP